MGQYYAYTLEVDGRLKKISRHHNGPSVRILGLQGHRFLFYQDKNTTIILG